MQDRQIYATINNQPRRNHKEPPDLQIEMHKPPPNQHKTRSTHYPPKAMHLPSNHQVNVRKRPIQPPDLHILHHIYRSITQTTPSDLHIIHQQQCVSP